MSNKEVNLCTTHELEMIVRLGKWYMREFFSIANRELQKRYRMREIKRQNNHLFKDHDIY